IPVGVFERGEISGDVAAILIAGQKSRHHRAGADVAGIFEPLVNPESIGASADVRKIRADAAGEVLRAAAVAADAVVLFDQDSPAFDQCLMFSLRGGFFVRYD